MKSNLVFLNIFSGQGGGGEVYLRRLIESMVSTKQFDCRLISPPCYAFKDIVLKVDEIKGVGGGNINTALYDMLFCIFEVNSLLRSINPDVLIINGDRAMLLAPFLITKARIVGVKHMLIDSWFKGLINRFVFRSYFKIVTISNFHIDNYIKMTQNKNLVDKLVMIYNSVDTNTFVYRRRDGNSGVIFLEIASLEARKGQMDLLFAFAKLIQIYPDIELWFAGVGRDQDAIKQSIAKHNLYSSVKLLGYRTDVVDLINGTDVIVLPSYNEGLPIVLLESLSCEHPVIATKIAGIPEVIENNNGGFLITPGNVDELFSSMLFFVSNKDKIREIGRVGRDVVKRKFDIKQWSDSWKHLLLSIDKSHV